MADEAAEEAGAELPPNQGATASRPLGETPLTVDSETDTFAERPEMFVGAAFAGGFALAMILRRFAAR